MRSHEGRAHKSAIFTPSLATTDVALVLRTGGFRVTNGRRALLKLLETAGVPLSVQDVLKKWQGKAPDTTTVYRSLTDLHAAGIVRRIELCTGTAHFEYTPTRPHHHHIVCTSCGGVEELEHCVLGDIEQQLGVNSKHFKNIYSHNLEFFGQCTACAVLK